MQKYSRQGCFVFYTIIQARYVSLTDEGGKEIFSPSTTLFPRIRFSLTSSSDLARVLRVNDLSSIYQQGLAKEKNKEGEKIERQRKLLRNTGDKNLFSTLIGTQNILNCS